MARLATFLTVLISMFVGSSVSASVVLSNTPSGGSIAAFGTPDTITYGQVFTAPVTGTLDSFTLWLNGGVGALHGAVGLWNGTPTHGFNFGESTNLYTSASVASTSAGPYTFAPGISVTAGTLYVAYLSVFGEANAVTTTSMPLAINAPGIDYFVWNNATDPQNNPAWNYFFDAGDVLFRAEFTPGSVVPEPTSMAVFGGVFCTFAAIGWRTRRRRG